MNEPPIGCAGRAADAVAAAGGRRVGDRPQRFPERAVGRAG